MKFRPRWVAPIAAAGTSLALAATAFAAPVTTTYQLSLSGQTTYYSPITVVEPFGGFNNDQGFGNFPGAPACPTSSFTDNVSVSGIGANEVLQYVVDANYIIGTTAVELPGYPQPSTGVTSLGGAGGTTPGTVGTGSVTIPVVIPSSTTWQSSEIHVDVRMQVVDASNATAFLTPSPFPMAASWDIFSSGCAPTSFGKGLTATIGFWHNKNGQALINSFNGSSGSTALGNWLAANFPNLYGCLAGDTNAQIAQLFLNDFNVSGAKVDAQVLSVALATYATDSSLAGGTQASQYGFKVGSPGPTGTALFNVGNDGAAVGVPNGTTETILAILHGADAQSSNCVLDGKNLSLLNQTNDLFDAINQGGDIG